MSETKWTPGEWQVGYGNGITGPTSVINHNAFTIDNALPGSILITTPDIDQRDFARSLGWDGEQVERSVYSSVIAIVLDRPEKKANANLLKAAPDLYDALEVAVQTALTQGWAISANSHVRVVYEQMQAAMRKARGEV